MPVGAITELIRGDVFYWGQLMAAALLGSIPVAVIYSFFVDYYVARPHLRRRKKLAAGRRSAHLLH